MLVRACVRAHVHACVCVYYLLFDVCAMRDTHVYVRAFARVIPSVCVTVSVYHI